MFVCTMYFCRIYRKTLFDSAVTEKPFYFHAVNGCEGQYNAAVPSEPTLYMVPCTRVFFLIKLQEIDFNNFSEFLRTNSFTEHLWWLLLGYILSELCLIV